MDIYVMSCDKKSGSKVDYSSCDLFKCDEDLTPRLAKRLTKTYNTTWSSDKLYKGSTFPLDSIVGYVYADQQVDIKLFNKLLKEQY